MCGDLNWHLATLHRHCGFRFELRDWLRMWVWYGVVWRLMRQIRVHVVRDRGWRIADVVVPGVTQELVEELK